MTSGELKQRALERTGEIIQPGDTPRFYSAAEALVAINAVQQIFCFLTLCLETEQSLPITANTTWYTPLSTFADWIAPIRVRTPGGARVKPARIAELDALDPAWQNAIGTQQRYCSLGFNLLGIYQAPAGSNTLAVTYARSATVLVADGDVPEIPPEYHPALVDGAIPFLRMKEGAGELQKVVPLFDRFLGSATKMASYVRQKNIGLRYDLVPFELDRFDRSNLLKVLTRPKPAAMEKAAPQG